MSATLILILIAALTSLGFLLEGWHYRRRLRRIPIRIHVNGTRGKSSVTRLICAGLNAGGIRTCAKTTGTLARMIFPDASELPIFRPCRANVIEQKRVIRAANQSSAKALVIECMALQPTLQSVCELQLVRSTHGVITNARADHLDVMGPTRLDVARALAGTTPVGGELFTAEQRDESLEVLRAAASDRGSQFEAISEFDRHRVTPEILARFSYLEHPENVALALRVCESLGVSREAALDGMWAATPDPGAMRVFRYPSRGRYWYFVNALAANDPESTANIWESACDRYEHVTKRIALMNCRHDRPERSQSMARACASWPMIDQVIVIGTGTDAFLKPLRRAGFANQRVCSLGNVDVPRIVEAIDTGSPENIMIVGIGNVAGPGIAVANYFQSTGSDSASESDHLSKISTVPSTTSQSPDLLKVA